MSSHVPVIIEFYSDGWVTVDDGFRVTWYAPESAAAKKLRQEREER